MLSDRQFIQYSRQIMLPQVSEQGIDKLQKASVTVIGAGGLGCLVTHQLTASGVGNIVVIDDDRVELSNLPRQLIYTNNDIGYVKSQRLCQRLSSQYQDTQLFAIEKRLVASNYQQLLGRYKSDIILDCSDNFTTRKLVNSISIQLSRPLVSAAVSKFESQILCVHKAENPQSGCYQCLIPNELNETENCASMGVMGSIVGVVASMQAWLAQQYLLNLGFPSGHLFRFDALNHQFIKAKLNGVHNCPICQS